MHLPQEVRRTIRRLELHARRDLARTLAGEYRSRQRGRGLEFAELRPYQPGDDVRRIDWKVTARSGIPQLRVHREERARDITLLLDVSASCSGEKRRLLVESAASLGFAAAAARDRLGLIAFSERIELLMAPRSGRHHVRAALHRLLTLQPAGRRTDLAEPLQAAERLHRLPGMLLLLTDFHAPLPERILRRCAHRHDLLALVLRDPRETALDSGGLLNVADRETGEERLLDTGRDGRRLAAAWHQIDRQLGANLRRMRIDHAFLNCGEPPLPRLVKLFRSRGGGL